MNGLRDEAVQSMITVSQIDTSLLSDQVELSQKLWDFITLYMTKSDKPSKWYYDKEGFDHLYKDMMYSSLCYKLLIKPTIPCQKDSKYWKQLFTDDPLLYRSCASVVVRHIQYLFGQHESIYMKRLFTFLLCINRVKKHFQKYDMIFPVPIIKIIISYALYSPFIEYSPRILNNMK